MYSDQDILSVYGLINGTPESGLRKMLIGGDFTESHFKILLKVSKGPSEAEFLASFINETLPTMRYGPAEMKIKEKFWGTAKSKLSSLGLLNLAAKAA